MGGGFARDLPDTARLWREDPELSFIIPAASTARREELARMLETWPHLPVTLVSGRAREAMAAADAVLLASGTATLEAALVASGCDRDDGIDELIELAAPEVKEDGERITLLRPMREADDPVEDPAGRGRTFQRVFSGAKWEEHVGYCRALRAGERVFVTGTAPVDPNGSVHGPNDGYAQAMRSPLCATAKAGWSAR